MANDQAADMAPVTGDDAERLGDDQEFDDEPECPRCGGDGRDPWCDYLMPCPECQGEQRP